MTTKFILTGCISMAAVATCLIPILAQEAADQNSRIAGFYSSSVGYGQRQAAEGNTGISVPSTVAPQARGFGGYTTDWSVQSPAPNSQLPSLTRLATTRSYFGQSHFDPELAKTINDSNAEVGKLIKQLKEAEDQSEKEAIKEKIKTELDLQYDAYLENHEKPLKQLEERLAKLREEFEARKQAKNDLVKLRLDTIWYDSQGLGWPSNRTTRPWAVNGARSLFPNPVAPPVPSAIPQPPNPPAPPSPPRQPAR